MTKFIGRKNNQVSTNAQLGGMAFQDSSNAAVGNIDIESISGSPDIKGFDKNVYDTAVDVFVYDTSKDSDGGAWRKRTQHTSWYNETLNTSTRGSRREFPAVAVIVAESDTLTIYDGDDPDLPMWMVFNLLGAVGTNSNMIPRGGSSSESDITSIACLNGRLAVGLKDVNGNVGEGLAVIDFISELARIHRGSASGYTGAIYGVPISGRNSNNVYSGDYNSLAVVSETINDVSMTVLPNAPIDPSTGLLIPTIAVATDGGVSVIKDDGTVVSYTRGGNEYTGSVAFDELDDLIISWGTSAGGYRHATRITNPFVGSTILDTTYGYIASDLGMGGSAAGNTNGVVTVANSGRHFGIDFDSSSGVPVVQNNHDDRVNFLHINDADTTKSLVAYVTTSYNTGWQHGAIKCAFLSDTDDTNVTGGGDGLITGSDSTFDDIIANLNWSERSGSGGAWNVSGGVLKTGTVSSGEYLDITTSGYTSGQTYVISYTLTNVTGSMPLRWRFNNGQMGNLPTSNGSHSYYVTLTETGTLFSLLNDANLTADIDNFKLQLVQEEDRSVNDRGLAVYGTITKSAVATGADLVAYSGFSASNYLQQPYNSNLGIDSTDSLSIICWTKASNSDSGLEIIFGTGVRSYGKGRYLYLSNGIPYLDTYGGAAQQATQAIDDGNWHHLVGIYTPSGGFVYVDGKLVATPVFNSGYFDQGSTTWFSRIGVSLTNTDPYDNGSIALLRISNSVPSPEQVKKIYEDEKVLFQENAKATLYGSSDAVTALAYDEITDQLHVGTSSGRSDFRGLRRINNTTTAVSTAISAHDGLIAQQ